MKKSKSKMGGKGKPGFHMRGDANSMGTKGGGKKSMRGKGQLK
jgi:hypothetical protein